MNEIITAAVKLIFAALGVLATTYLVPWLKEKRLYDTVVRLVRAAEKLAQNATLDKKAYVVAALGDLGIKVTPTVEALIEAAVEELDIACGKAGEASAPQDDEACGMTD